MSTIWRETGLEITSWASSIKCFKYGGSHTLISWPLYFYTLDSLIIRCLHWGSHKPLQKEHSSIFFSISVPLEATKYIHTLYLYVWHRLHKRPQMLAFGCVSNWPRSFFIILYYLFIKSLQATSWTPEPPVWWSYPLFVRLLIYFLLRKSAIKKDEAWCLTDCVHICGTFVTKLPSPGCLVQPGNMNTPQRSRLAFICAFYRQWHFTTILGWGSSIY